MRLTDLKPGDFFQLEGAPYECQYVSPSGRIVMAYVLQDVGHITNGRLPEYDSHYERVPDPNDLTGDEFLTTVFSDLRFNREHETDEDRELDALL